MDTGIMQDVVVYDGRCNFCRSQIAIIKFLDISGRFTFESCHEPVVRLRFEKIKYEDCLERMYVISMHNKIYGGIDAIKYISRKLLLLWPLALLIHVPFTQHLWSQIYEYIARNR